MRRDIEKISISTDEYSTAHEVSLVLFMDRMPLSLTKFICWLLDYKSFKNESEPYNILNDKLQKVMGITECITAHEVSLVLSMDRMPLSLTKFICWLLDYKSFKNESEPYNILNDKLQKVMGITECIFPVSRDVFTNLVLLYSCTTISVQSNLSRHYTLIGSVLLMEKSDDI